MNILITGGLGFIGNHLVRHLINASPENKIVVIDNLSSGSVSFLKDIRSKFTFYNIDIINKGELDKCFKKERPDIIIHLAAIHFIPECNQNPPKTISVNIIGTHNVVDLANKYNVKQFIFASSASVYGATRKKNNEDDVPNPVDIYGCSKLCGEQITKTLCQVNWSILRFFNVIGTNETHEHLLPVIIKQLKNDRGLVLGNLESTRDYLFVGDLVNGVSRVINNKKAYSQVLNLGTGRGTSVRNVVRGFEVALKKRIEIEQSANLKRSIDNPVLVASIEKIQKLINWQPEYHFQEALNEILFAK
ncbi:NAD-dependent epimerase/dehydratase family protein [Candidatus Nomurabacteria bacterium]|nr:NAD-dependent epimerase/dehydratase family protein [Candidatus Nomurabacteria bacterium]